MAISAMMGFALGQWLVSRTARGCGQGEPPYITRGGLNVTGQTFYFAYDPSKGTLGEYRQALDIGATGATDKDTRHYYEAGQWKIEYADDTTSHSWTTDYTAVTAPGQYTATSHWSDDADLPEGEKPSRDDSPDSAYDASVTIVVFKIQIVTPSGDPTSTPVDAGNGQNEFTFSPDNPAVLEINLAAAVSPTGISSQIANRCHFTVDAIGNSTMTWDSANPDGKPTASNDSLSAKATFTGLPASNASFGAKKAALFFDTSQEDENLYEVFFPKWAMNHPGGNATDPNWYFYWQEGAVCGIDTNCAYDGSHQNTWGYCHPGVDTIVRLCPLAPESNSGPESYYSQRSNDGYGAPPNGQIVVTGEGEGIQCVAETIQHEREHLNIYDQFHGQTDTDVDGIRDASETTNSATSYGGVTSDPNDADTYNMGGGYSSYGDNEIRCRKIELNLTIAIHPDLDWANPGCQNKSKCGP